MQLVCTCLKHSDTVVPVLWLSASGTLSDDSCTVTWCSVTARRLDWQCVADSAVRQTYACFTGCVFMRGSEWSRDLCCVVVLICVNFICTCCGVCTCKTWNQSALVCLCVYGLDVLVGMFSTSAEACCVCRCVWLWQPPCPPRRLLSHAGCFCQCWAEAVTPQRFTVCLCCWSLCSWTCIFSAEQTAPCWLLRTVKRLISWRDLDFILIVLKCLKIILHENKWW